MEKQFEAHFIGAILSENKLIAELKDFLA